MGRLAPLIALAATLLISGCHHEDAETARALVATAPLTSPGFPPTTATAKDQLGRLKVEWGKNWETYKREEFGKYWSDETDAVGGRNGCR